VGKAFKIIGIAVLSSIAGLLVLGQLEYIGVIKKPTDLSSNSVSSNAVNASSKPSFDTALLSQMVFNMTNQERIHAGLKPVQWDNSLAQLAIQHTQDMLDRNYYDHNTPEGKTPNDRAIAAGYKCGNPQYGGVAENLNEAGPAYGDTSAESAAYGVMQSWMNSPGHRENILAATHQKLGVGTSMNDNGTALIAEEFC